MQQRSALPATLRDVNNAAFLHRDRARFRAGESGLLAIVLEPAAGDGIVVDVTQVPDLRSIAVAPDGAATVGAFATPAAVAAALPALFGEDTGVENVRARLAAFDARVTILGRGATRVAPFDACTFAPYELPVSIAIPARPAGLVVAQRRRSTQDGPASFSLGVTVALRVSALGRFERVRLLIDFDGAMRRANEAEAVLERARFDGDLFPAAARTAAASLSARDARTSAAVRALQPLALAALRDAFERARGPA